jgi:hypothetical protein
MELSIKSLRDSVDPFLAELGTLYYRHGSGLSPTLPLVDLYRRYSELGQPEAFALVREALERRSMEEDDKRRARALLEFLASQVEDRLAAEAVEEIASLEGAQVAVPNGTQPFRDAVAQLPVEPSRARRDLMEQALSGFLFENQRPYARRRDAATESARRLGFDGYLALRDFVSGFSHAELVAECDAVLHRTEDAYRDVLGYALKKMDPDLRLRPNGSARRHDVVRASSAPWLGAAFRREDLLPAVIRCVEEMGFHPSAHGRIQLDTDDRPGKSPRAFVADVRIPDDVRLVVRGGQGLDGYFSLLHEYGHALHFAHVSRTAPVEHRRLGDASVSEAWAFLFDHFLIDEKWHRRMLRLTAPMAREAARLAAFNNLVMLRRYCVKLGYELSLYARGPVRELAEEYEERHSAALHVGIPKGFFLYDVDPHLFVARYLRAWALEARLHPFLCERFDEDYWRNPATGRWLAQCFERGQRDDAESIAMELSRKKLSLVEAGERLVAVLNR